jgi:hypothetical protein
MRSFLKRENAWIWVILILFGFNILTLDLYTSVWMDEVMYTQPAANEHLGLGFTSTAWDDQNPDLFFAANVPLHPLLLCLWYKCFGFGFHQTRIFGFTLWSLGVWAVCLAARRAGWIKSPAILSLLAILLFIGQNVAFCYRSGRYDPLAFLLVSLCFLAFTVKKTAWRLALILAVTSFFLPAYLPLGPFCLIFGILLGAVTRTRFFMELTCAALGVALGLGLLYCFYQHYGVWDDFLRQVHSGSENYYNGEGHQQTHAGLMAGKMHDLLYVLIGDRSSVVLLVGSILLLVARKKNAPLPNRNLVVFNILAFVAIPVGLLLSYAFPIYYWWMRYVPLGVLFGTLMDGNGLQIPVAARRGMLAFVLLTLSVSGLPARIIFAMSDLPERDYRNVTNFVRQSVQANDIVYADHQAFYPLEQLKLRTYYPRYRITPEQAASVNCLILDPEKFPATQKVFGGNWQPTGQQYSHEQHFGIHLLDKFMPGYFVKQTNRKYNLVVYRKETAAK